MVASLAAIPALIAKAGTITTLLTAGSTVATIGAGVMQYRAAKNAGAMAVQNAKYMQDAADIQREAGNKDSDILRKKAAAFAGNKKAQLAAQGVDVGSANSLDLLADDKETSEVDAFEIREGASNRADGTERQAFNQMQGAETSGYEATGALLGSASKVSSRWAAWQDYREPTG